MNKNDNEWGREMEGEYFKSYPLLVPIMSHDEYNYLTAPPIHQWTDGAQSKWFEWGAGYYKKG